MIPSKSGKRLAATCSLVLAGALSATVAPLSAQAETAPTTVVCNDLGEVKASRSGTTWQLVDEPQLSVAATGLPCRAATADAQGHLTSSGPALFHVAVDTESVLAAAEKVTAERRAATSDGERRVQAAAVADPAGYGPVTAFPYQSQLSSYLAGRPGNVAVAWRKQGTSTIHSYYKGRASNVTASIVKVQIMATVMYQAQQKGRGLTEWEKQQMVPMIRVSDNDAATNLWRHVGGAPAVQAVNNRMGLRETVNASAWGLTVTTAPDQVVLMDHFARKNPVLSDAMRAHGLGLMRGASSWGVNQGPGTDIAVKNGWLPRTDGWHVNSIGYNHHTPGAYSAAVLTHSSSAGLETQKATIAGASRIMYGHRNDSTPAPTPRAVRGDFSGDGRADLFGVKGDNLFLFRAEADRRLTAPQQVGGGGWSRFTWLGSPGDVTRDGITDLLARDIDGNLHLYRGTGKGTLGYVRQVGVRWNGITAFATVGDFDGDRTPDLVARAANGDLHRYVLPAIGGARDAGVVGQRWGGMRALLGTSGINGDARGDLLAIRHDGKMFAYTSTGRSFAEGREVGHGWRPSLVALPGDLTGDGYEDIAYQTSSALATYPVVRDGRVGAARNNPTTAAGFRLIG